VRGEVLLGPLEVVGLDVGGAGVAVAEGFDEDVLVGVVEGAGPVVPQAAGLVAGGGGELAGDLGPVVGVLGQHLELGGDEDHEALLCTGSGGSLYATTLPGPNRDRATVEPRPR
jgi:hypothetical protein